MGIYDVIGVHHAYTGDVTIGRLSQRALQSLPQD